MKKIILVLALLILSTPAMAAERLEISVNGLVCDFCARAIEKVFSKEDSVASVTVNLTTKIITAILKDQKTLSDERVKTLITDAGYNMVSITRDQVTEEKK